MSTWTDRAVLDLRHSLRVLGKSPVFTAAAVLSLALGIGANTAIFSLVDAVMLRALPVESPQQLVQLRVGERRGDATTFTNPIWEEIRNRQQIFGGVFAFSQVPLDVGSGLENQFADGLYVSGDFFRTLHVPAFAGRLLTVDDDRRGGGTEGWVAVLGHAYWRDRYGASPSVIGSTIRLAGNPFTIVGVAPPGFFGVTLGSRFDIAIPLAAEAAINRSGSMLDRRGNWWVSIMGRLKPGQSLEQAQAGLHALAPQVREATLPTHPDAKVREAYLTDPLTLAPASTGAFPAARTVSHGAAHADGRRGRGAADRVREPREPAARPRLRTAEGVGAAARARRVARPARAPAPHREPAARARRRRARPAVRALGRRADRAADLRRALANRARPDAGRLGARLHDAARDADRLPVRPRASVPFHRPERERPAARQRAIDCRRLARLHPREAARRRPDGLLARADLRRGAARPQLCLAGHAGPGLRSP